MLDGQSASGKTHTLKGQEDDPGLIMLAMKDIVEFIETHSGIRYSIKFSCYQISNESINDLLGDNQQTVSNSSFFFMLNLESSYRL